jgi:hypothetical protein
MITTARNIFLKVTAVTYGRSFPWTCSSSLQSVFLREFPTVEAFLSFVLTIHIMHQTTVLKERRKKQSVLDLTPLSYKQLNTLHADENKM